MQRKAGKSHMSQALRATAAVSPSKGRTVRKTPREVLQDLRNRAGLTAAEVARLCGYKSTNGYIRFEYEAQGNKLIPYSLVRKLLPLFVGKGTPPITADELIAITEARTIGADAKLLAQAPAPPVTPGALVERGTVGPLLHITYRVEPGVFLEASLAGTKVYGESNIAPAFDVDARAQFCAVVSDDPKRTVLHCVKPDQFGKSSRAGKRCVCMVPRGNSGLVEVVLSAYDADGEAPAGTVVGVVIGSYVRE